MYSVYYMGVCIDIYKCAPALLPAEVSSFSARYVPIPWPLSVLSYTESEKSPAANKLKTTARALEKPLGNVIATIQVKARRARKSTATCRLYFRPTTRDLSTLRACLVFIYQLRANAAYTPWARARAHRHRRQVANILFMPHCRLYLRTQCIINFHSNFACFTDAIRDASMLLYYIGTQLRFWISLCLCTYIRENLERKWRRKKNKGK